MIGDFKDNAMTGWGTYTYANGTVEEGRWEDGTYLGS